MDIGAMEGYSGFRVSRVLGLRYVGLRLSLGKP